MLSQFSNHSISIPVHTIASVECYTDNSHKCPVVTGCDHLRSAATVDYSSQVLYEGCTSEKKAQIYRKAEEASSWLAATSQLMCEAIL